MMDVELAKSFLLLSVASVIFACAIFIVALVINGAANPKTWETDE